MTSEPDTKLQVRDHRPRSGWFTIDNHVIDHWDVIGGPELTGVGLALYLVLCRYADNNSQQCFIGINKISLIIGVSRRTTERYLVVLAERKLLHVGSGKTVGNTNTYTLLPIVAVVTPAPNPEGTTFLQSGEGGCDKDNVPGATNLFGGCDISDIAIRKKKTKGKKTTPEPSASDDAVDHEYQPIVAAFTQAYEHHTGRKLHWCTRAFLELKKFRARWTDWRLAEFQAALQNFYASDNAHPGEPPETLIPKLSKYADGPLNQFGHLRNGNGNGNGQSKSEQRTAYNNRVTEQAIKELNSEAEPDFETTADNCGSNAG